MEKDDRAIELPVVALDDTEESTSGSDRNSTCETSDDDSDDSDTSQVWKGTMAANKEWSHAESTTSGELDEDKEKENDDEEEKAIGHYHSSEEKYEKLAGEVSFCPDYTENGRCLVTDCMLVHGERCAQCRKYCLDPRDEGQRRLHHAGCILEQQGDKYQSDLLDRARDQMCCICLEMVLEKPARKRRFGILPKCKHTFCLSCIRTWRKADTERINRSCPVCRVRSDFVIPSFFWIEDEAEKKATIKNYRNGCKITDCKHFKKGKGECPFSRRCFYRHALPSGELVKKRQPRDRAMVRRHVSPAYPGSRMPLIARVMVQCEMCHKFCLVHGDKKQNERHLTQCIKARVEEIDAAFVKLQVRDQTCDICLEVVTEKPLGKRRFGILPNCKHTFCVECIKTWRNSSEYTDDVKKGCPTCRVKSPFYFPSSVWVETEQEKRRQHARFRASLKHLDCKRYNKGAGTSGSRFPCEKGVKQTIGIDRPIPSFRIIHLLTRDNFLGTRIQLPWAKSAYPDEEP
uniref:RING-type E3 ubiquitin transferase n=1 Tax=Anopheles epiroticus TaxID=199890 RepID=A0A182PEP5_9DIPT